MNNVFFYLQFKHLAFLTDEEIKDESQFFSQHQS